MYFGIYFSLNVKSFLVVSFEHILKVYTHFINGRRYVAAHIIYITFYKIRTDIYFRCYIFCIHASDLYLKLYFAK